MKTERNAAPCCLITGASRGLGFHLALSFWEAGWSLVLVARSSKQLEDLAGAMTSRPRQTVNVIVADLADPAAPDQVIAAARKLTRGIEMLINNAAVQGPVGPLWKNDWQAWEATLRVDLLAPAALCRATLPWMIETGGGRIVNVSGGGAAGPRPNFSAYAAAKAGLVRFSETLAEEARPFNISVNCIAPGAMNTAMLRDVFALGAAVTGEREHALAAKAIAASGDMPCVARLCLFLASTQGQRITGKLISAIWDDWTRWPDHIEALESGDLYTLRRVTARDRGLDWGDK